MLKSTAILIIILSVICLIKTDNLHAQVDLETLVKEVQANTQKSYDSIKSVKFTGRSKSFEYINWKMFGMDLVEDYEEYFFEGFWIKPDSIRVKITAMRSIDSDTVKKRIRFGRALPNPFRFSYNSSAFNDLQISIKR